MEALRYYEDKLKLKLKLNYKINIIINLIIKEKSNTKLKYE